MEGAAGGVAAVAGLTDEEVAAFVVASCRAQGVPVKVTDVKVLGEVAALFGGRGRAVGDSRQRGTERRSGALRAAR